ncbi:hypothetical protein [Okeania hirsuta]|uniref:hypothetical protein n=1 Tax=Okeania hirsuta TaxID=1458930 RepID=UPI000F526036|nr:hypothetical protein [Okeania hirsuta]
MPAHIAIVSVRKSWVKKNVPSERHWQICLYLPISSYQIWLNSYRFVNSEGVIPCPDNYSHSE